MRLKYKLNIKKEKNKTPKPQNNPQKSKQAWKLRKETKAFVEGTWNPWLDLAMLIFIVIIPSALGVFLPSVGLLSPIHRVLTSYVLSNLSGWSLHTLSGQPAPLLSCPHGEGRFLMTRLNLSCSSLGLLPLILLPCPTVWSLAPLSWWYSHRFWWAAVRYPEATSFLDRTSPVPSASPWKTSDVATNCLDSLLLTSLQLKKCLLCIGQWSKLNAAF